MNIKILLLPIFIWLSGCASQGGIIDTLYPKMDDYIEPETGDYAEVYFDGSEMKGVFIFGKKIEVKLYDGCYEKNAFKESALGKIEIPESEFDSRGLKIPTNTSLFLTFGLKDFCHANYGFTPEAGAKYKVSLKTAFAHCSGSLVKLENDKEVPVPDAKFYKVGSWSAAAGDTDSWRTCKKINKKT